MHRRQRLRATLRGESVDHPSVCFYEIDGYRQHPDDPDPDIIYAHPSWQPMLALARQCSDRIVMCNVPLRDTPPNPLAERTHIERREVGASRLTLVTINAGGRILTERSRRDRDVDTTWGEEHLPER